MSSNKSLGTTLKNLNFLTVVKYLLLILTILGEIIALFFTIENIQNSQVVNVLIMLPFVLFLIPYLFLSLYGYKLVKSKMEVVPRFLRDIVDNIESGMDMVSAVINSSSNEYGILNDDVARFANQLSWGIKFDDAFLNFANQVGDSGLRRDFLLVREAKAVGGHVEILLRELSEKIDNANIREKERKGALASNTFTGYISFIIFLFILIIIYNSLFLELADEADGDMIQTSEAEIELFLTLLILLSYEVSILSGFLFGMMQENSLISGAPHVVALVVMTFIGFFFFIG